MLRPLLTTCALALVLCRSATACPLPDGGSTGLGQRTPEERLTFLRQHLASETQRAQRWTLGWTIGFSTLAAGQLALIPVARRSEGEALNRASQPDLWLGAGASTVGLVTLLASRLPVLNDGPAFELRLRQPAGDPCPLIAEGEAALARSAQGEQVSAGPLMHVANAAFNVGVGLVLGVVFHRWRTAVINTVVGTGIGELKILTQPTGSIDAWRRYQAAELPEQSARVRWQLVPAANGVSLAGAF